MMLTVLEYFPYLALIGATLLSKRTQERELAKLSVEETGRLSKGFLYYRIAQLGMLLFMAWPALSLSRHEPPYEAKAWLVFFFGLTLVVFWFTTGYAILRWKLRQLEISEVFIRAYLGDRVLLGVIMFAMLFSGAHPLFAGLFGW